MAAITSIRSGGWSDTNTATNAWGAAPPTSADTVTIANTHTVTIDGACVALSVAVTGVLSVSNSVSTTLTVQQGVSVANSVGSSYQCDLSAAPTVTHTLLLNSSALTSNQTGTTLNLAGGNGYPVRYWNNKE